MTLIRSIPIRVPAGPLAAKSPKRLLSWDLHDPGSGEVKASKIGLAIRLTGRHVPTPGTTMGELCRSYCLTCSGTRIEPVEAGSGWRSGGDGMGQGCTENGSNTPEKDTAHEDMFLEVMVNLHGHLLFRPFPCLKGICHRWMYTGNVVFLPDVRLMRFIEPSSPYVCLVRQAVCHSRSIVSSYAKAERTEGDIFSHRIESAMRRKNTIAFGAALGELDGTATADIEEPQTASIAPGIRRWAAQ